MWERFSLYAMKAVLGGSLALTACNPASPGNGTEGNGNDATSTMDEASSTVTEQDDSTGTTGVEFACPGARWHEGKLRIDDTTDVESLRDVGGVTGSLSIGATSKIVDLEFLSCLEIVEGTVWIHDNENLGDLHGLERLRVIGGAQEGALPPLWHLGLQRNPARLRIDSLDSLETLGILVIESNESLMEIEMSALREVETLLLGGYCVPGGPRVGQLFTSVGDYPVLERVQSFVLYGQYQFTSTASLVELAERGVAFEEAYFEGNTSLPLSEIDAFAAAASLVPYTCSNMDETEECSCPVD